MGQWSGLREAVLGPVHQRFRSRDMYPEPDYPGPDPRSGRHVGVPALEARRHHRPLDHRLRFHREPIGYLNQRGVSAVSPPRFFLPIHISS